MSSRGKSTPAELRALLIAPNRELAEQFRHALAETRAFQILDDLKKYPSRAVLEGRLRQLRPEVVLLDLSQGLDAAGELLQFMTKMRQPVHVIALHETGDPTTVLRALRLGASEFLSAPFEASVQRDAVAGILRLRHSAAEPDAEPGRVVAFSSAKPGSGASTLACHSAFALRQITGQRVLLADLDLAGGTLAFYLRLNHPSGSREALEAGEQLDVTLWAGLTADCRGVDVLVAPREPFEAAVKPGNLRQVLDYARGCYDWILLDLPATFHRLSLQALWEADRAFLVTTSELPSLYLARKAVGLLSQLGLGKDRVEVVVNRMGDGGRMSESDLKKIFGSAVHGCFPYDYASLHRVVTLGEPLDAGCELGKAVGDFAGRLAGAGHAEKRKAGWLWARSPAWGPGLIDGRTC